MTSTAMIMTSAAAGVGNPMKFFDSCPFSMNLASLIIPNNTTSMLAVTVKAFSGL